MNQQFDKEITERYKNLDNLCSKANSFSEVGLYLRRNSSMIEEAIMNLSELDFLEAALKRSTDLALTEHKILCQRCDNVVGRKQTMLTLANMEMSYWSNRIKIIRERYESFAEEIRDFDLKKLLEISAWFIVLFDKSRSTEESFQYLIEEGLLDEGLSLKWISIPESISSLTRARIALCECRVANLLSSMKSDELDIQDFDRLPIRMVAGGLMNIAAGKLEDNSSKPEGATSRAWAAAANIWDKLHEKDSLQKLKEEKFDLLRTLRNTPREDVEFFYESVVRSIQVQKTILAKTNPRMGRLFEGTLNFGLSAAFGEASEEARLQNGIWGPENDTGYLVAGFAEVVRQLTPQDVSEVSGVEDFKAQLVKVMAFCANMYCYCSEWPEFKMAPSEET
tara:strand:+ start:14187 stop:15368 length:1182 start_codon:yes stop_codon:yes gene_type:complete